MILFLFFFIHVMKTSVIIWDKIYQTDLSWKRHKIRRYSISPPRKVSLYSSLCACYFLCNFFFLGRWRVVKYPPPQNSFTIIINILKIKCLIPITIKKIMTFVFRGISWKIDKTEILLGLLEGSCKSVGCGAGGGHECYYVRACNGKNETSSKSWLIQ